MKPHKWAKEIKAWADGAEIEYTDIDGCWNLATQPYWDADSVFLIKPHPKEPQYLYVWKDNLHEIKLTTNPPHPLKEYVSINFKCIGKIKLEVDND